MKLSKKYAVAMTLVLGGLLTACSDGSTEGGSGGDLITGTAGSTARMTIAGDYLYAIAGSRVQLFDITTPQTPAPWTQVQIDWNIQTLFPYNQYLLVGAANGVHILDNSDPASPQQVGDFRHATAIDPVVAQDDVAYVTLKRDTSRPGPGIANQMNVVDIRDVTNPQLLDTIPMQGPAGLSVQGQRLYVCDGVAGLKTFDISDPVNPVAIDALNGVDCRDVIALNEQLYVIDERGLSQYDLTTGKPMLMSTVDAEPVVYVINQ